jgi:biopolymer transport protein ExbB
MNPLAHSTSLANLVLGQAAPTGQGWLTTRLLTATLSSAEWVVWLLAILSILSVAVMLERLAYFASRRLPNSSEFAVRLSRGELGAVAKMVDGRQGMEAAVIREGVAAAGQGADTVEQVVASVIARERPQYERFLSFLGTLGNNAPFVGLFGTVLGIIKAFHDLGRVTIKGAAIQQTVMTGISEALVATAVGLAVAIPAVVSFNAFNRWLKTITARTNALGHALVGYLRSEADRPEAATLPRPATGSVREVR